MTPFQRREMIPGRAKEANTMQNEQATLQHRLTIDERTGMTISGVTDVPSFCEQTIVAATVCGDVTVMGEDMHISRLNLNDGVVQIEGTINALEYSAGSAGKKSLLGRLWK